MDLFWPFVIYLVVSLTAFAVCVKLSLYLLQTNKIKFKDSFWFDLVLPIIICIGVLIVIMKVF